ncbi:hypothetical protein [Chondrinema litorale]|uniref:hypothetical protein n=1 Tax=Chondrinema litorale TaxID=2994555 RepID=UPI002542EEC0|nr:hypothetical protein [Chondrinema litorale]UZR93651.1 hypothetical protein OQ292_17520 [Chondrinema litorale]
MLKKGSCLYQEFYCEENIWHLCQQKELQNLNSKVIFLLPLYQYIAVWQSRLAKKNMPILWDYHVILFVEEENSIWHVYDFDTVLPFKSKAEDYFNVSFSEWYPDFLPFVKLIDRKEYVSHFHSDRSHMVDEFGNWEAPPPEWQTIINEEGVPLADILNLENQTIGKCYSFAEFKTRFKL